MLAINRQQLQQRQQELSEMRARKTSAAAQPGAGAAGAGQDAAAAGQRARSPRSTSCASSARCRAAAATRAGQRADRARPGVHRRGAAQGPGDRAGLPQRGAQGDGRGDGQAQRAERGRGRARRQGRQVADQEPGARARAAAAGQHRRRRRAAGQGHRRDRAARRRAGAGGAACCRKDIAFIAPRPGRDRQVQRLRFLDLRRHGRAGREHQPRHRGRRTRQRLLPGAGANDATPSSATSCRSSPA